jgi:hypothetical protein
VAITSVLPVGASVTSLGGHVGMDDVNIEHGDGLAELIRLYWKQVDEFNRTDHETDEESDAHAEATWEVTQDRMIGVPVRTKEDAFAAVDFLTREGYWHMLEFHTDEKVGFAACCTSLIHAVRAYLAEEARS